jgi:hypothetical protein
MRVIAANPMHAMTPAVRSLARNRKAAKTRQ